MVQLVEVLHDKTGGRGFDIRWGNWNLSSDLILLYAFGRPGIDSISNRNYKQGISLGVKSAGAYG